MIAAWLGSSIKYKSIYVNRSGNVHELCITHNYIKDNKMKQYDHAFAIIGESWVAVPTRRGESINIEAADPEFFTKLESAIETVKNSR